MVRKKADTRLERKSQYAVSITGSLLMALELRDYEYGMKLAKDIYVTLDEAKQLSETGTIVHKEYFLENEKNDELE